MSETQQRTYAIEALVRRRCDELGLTQPELIRRCGYQNVSKGLRRLEQLRASDFKKSAGLIDKLPAALEVPVEVIKRAVEEFATISPRLRRSGLARRIQTARHHPHRKTEDQTARRAKNRRSQAGRSQDKRRAIAGTGTWCGFKVHAGTD